MDRGTCFRFFLPAAVCAGALLTAGCVQPLGPGFHFEGRQAEIRASVGSPDRLHIRVVDHMENDGNRTLRSLEVRLPEGPNFGTQNLHLTVDGKPAPLNHSSTTDPRMMQATFDPPWEQQRPRDVATQWDLFPGASARGTVAVSANAFYIADQTALPLWQAPVGVFAKGGPVPDDATLTVIAPQDFRILAPGKPLKGGIEGNLATHRFRIRPDKDFLPYVVAGRYQEQVIRARHVTVTFWTFRPLAASEAKKAGAALASSMDAFVDFFGAPSKGKPDVRIVEAPGDLPAEFGDSNASGGTSFPEGVLLDSRAIAEGVGKQAVLQLSEYELARTWFGWRVRPMPEAQLLMGRGVGLFALVVAAESRGPDQRRSMVISLLDRYDRARSVSADKRLMEPPAGYSRAERISTGYRGALFLVALDDLCGHDQMRAAFREIVRSRSGDQTGYEELRSALELASGRNLAEMFRNWLIRPGVPDDFRARYTGSPSAGDVSQ